MFEKFLVLTDGMGTVVGGVLFYGSVDIQATVLEEYRGRGFMSAIHHNGIMSTECYEEQKVSIVMKDRYETELEELNQLTKKRDELRNKELLQAIEQSKHSFEEIMDFLSTDDSQD